jgi:hypothetical protein
MPKKKTPVRSPWTKDDIRQLKVHSKARTPAVAVAKAMKRTEAAVRQSVRRMAGSCRAEFRTEAATAVGVGEHPLF